MNLGPLAPPSKRKLIVYGYLLFALVVVTWAVLVLVEVPWGLAMLLMALFTTIVGGGIASFLWVNGGSREEVSTGSRKVILPTRMRRAMPYIFAIAVLVQLVRLVELLGSK